MKFELRLDAELIYNAIELAQKDGADSLSLIIHGNIDENGKAKVSKAELYGECTTEYCTTIKV